MDDVQFDSLTRTLALGVSRRRALKLIAAHLLAVFGLANNRSSTTSALAQPGATKVWLPLVAQPRVPR